MLSSGAMLQSSRFPQEPQRESPINSSPAVDAAFELSSSGQHDDTSPGRAREAESRAHPAFLVTKEEGLARNILPVSVGKGGSHPGELRWQGS